MTLLLTVHLITLTHIVNLRQIILNREIRITVIYSNLNDLFLQLAKKYNMVIISPIIERDEVHGDILANTAGM
jgi:REP element-mobilizing transposase RayT